MYGGEGGRGCYKFIAIDVFEIEEVVFQNIVKHLSLTGVSTTLVADCSSAIFGGRPLPLVKKIFTLLMF